MFVEGVVAFLNSDNLDSCPYCKAPVISGCTIGMLKLQETLLWRLRKMLPNSDQYVLAVSYHEMWDYLAYLVEVDFAAELVRLTDLEAGF
jgi:hypothetical protein